MGKISATYLDKHAYKKILITVYIINTTNKNIYISYGYKYFFE